jgi:hypothetical protein
MSDETLSPDGAWRWDGERWVPNQPSPPSYSLGAAQHDVPIGASRDRLVVPALVAGGIGLMAVAVHLLGDTIRAFGDPAQTGQPWYLDTWFVVLQFLIGVVALALASLAAVRSPGRLPAVAMAIAGGVFLQGFVYIYYRVVVSYFGYDVPF